MKLKMKLTKPSVEECKKYIEKANTPKNKHYVIQEDITKSLFAQYPKNTDVEEVFVKAKTLNLFYSTQIISIYSIAEVICSLDIDKKLKDNDFNVVNEIADTIKAKCNGKRREYVFAAKYCALHKLDVFPLFDSKAETALIQLNKEHPFSDFENSALRDYPKYVKIYHEFIQKFSLEQLSLREIDLYLWTLGKEIS